MAQPFAAPPINPLISVQPLNTPQAGRDAPEVPAALTTVANGTTVEGFVVNRDAQNNPILRTPLGDILIKSDFFLKTGSVVVFRVDNTQASRARIITIDGLTPTDYAAQQTRTPHTDTIEQSALPNPPALIEEAEQQSQLQGKPATPPIQPPSLKAVLVAPATVLTPDTKPSSTTPATTSFTPVSAQVQAETPLPLILAKLQTGALLKIIVLKAELPVAIPTPSASHTASMSANTPAPFAAPTTANTTINPAASTVGATALPPTVLAVPTSTNIASTSPVFQTAGFISPSQANDSPLPALPATTPAVSTTQSTTPIEPHLSVAAPSPNQPLSIPAQPGITPAAPQRSATTSTPPVTPAAPESTVLPPKSTTYTPPSLSVATTAFSAYRTATIRAPQSPEAPSAAHPIQPAPLHPVTVTPSHASTASSAAARQDASTVFTATVIGHELDGATILHTRVGTLKTFLPQPLPTGTQLTVQIEPDDGLNAPPPTAGTLSESMETVTTLARDWKGLVEALQWLQANDSASSSQLVQQLPNAGPRLASGLLFFIAAIKGGDIRAWLGNRAVDALEKKAPELISRLRADTSQLQQLASETPGRNWAMLMLPVMVDGQLEQARLFHRQEEEPTSESGKKDGGRHHRFIIEVDLSQLGSLQFDGFVRDGREKRVFDLIIRSARPLAGDVSAAIRDLFDNALKTTGYRGYLTFQQGSQHFVRPLANFHTNGGDAQPILA